MISLFSLFQLLLYFCLCSSTLCDLPVFLIFFSCYCVFVTVPPLSVISLFFLFQLLSYFCHRSSAFCDLPVISFSAVTDEAREQIQPSCKLQGYIRSLTLLLLGTRPPRGSLWGVSMEGLLWIERRVEAETFFSVWYSDGGDLQLIVCDVRRSCVMPFDEMCPVFSLFHLF